jgi:type VI protein secretion system component Hcp
VTHRLCRPRGAGALAAAAIVGVCLLIGPTAGAPHHATIPAQLRPVAAGQGIYMTVGTCPGGGGTSICGDSTAPGHAGAMTLTTVSFKGTTPGSAGGPTGPVRFDDLTVDKSADPGSAPLLSRLATYTRIGPVVVSFDRAGPTGAPVTVLRYTINPATVTSYSLSTDGSGHTEHLTMAIAAVKIEYFAITQTGATQAIGTFCWNVTTNAATCP